MSKFNDLFNKIIFEEGMTLPTVDTILPRELCNPMNCFRWNKGQANVYACMIIPENADLCTQFLKGNRENSNTVAKVGRYLVYNPNIPEEDGQVWMNKLQGYIKATPENSNFDSLMLNVGGLNFEEYVYIPKTGALEEGLDTFVAFQIPEGMTFNIPAGCGNNGADGSQSFATDWLPIVNGKFDWSRSRGSMKQSNFICVGKEQAEILPECLEAWNKQNNAN